MLIQAMGFAQFERETIVGRIKNGSRARAKRGLANGCAPLGFDLVPNKPNHRQVNEDERPYVELIFRKMLELKKMEALIKFLNTEGCLVGNGSCRILIGGAYRDRTCDLNAASVALSQLS